jgi:nickel-dependent lactate racemase
LAPNMRKVTLPYLGKTLGFEIPEESTLEIVHKEDCTPLPDVVSAARDALQKPIAAKRIAEDVTPESKVIILVDDWTRATPAHVLIPLIIEELKQAGVRDDNISFLYATGQHPATWEQVVDKIGKSVTERYQSIMHDAEKHAEHAFLGFTSRGTPVWVNKAIKGASYLIGIGGVKPNDTPGWSGGCKIIMPGISGCETIKHTHIKQLASNRPDQYGAIENPIRLDIEEIGDMAGLNFILNVVWNRNTRVCHIVAGNPHTAWQKGVQVARNVFEYKVRTRADIAIVYLETSPYLSDAVFAATRGFYITKDEGTIVVVSPCTTEWASEEDMKVSRQWYPRKEWLKWSLGEITWKAMRDEIPVRSSNYIAGFKLTTERRHVVFVSDENIQEETRAMGADYETSISRAVATASKRYGEKTRVILMPYDSNLIPVD